MALMESEDTVEGRRGELSGPIARMIGLTWTV
jgi:hypothetical protein